MAAGPDGAGGSVCPWLDSRNSALLRATGQGILEPLTKVRPRARLRLPELGFYWRSISREADGEWDLHPLWRPEFGFPIRAGWLAAVLAGHYRVARGLNIPVPILVLASARSDLGPAWTGAKLETASVLDVRVMVRRAAQLGRTVTICRFDGALHDVLLSHEPVRAHVYGTLEKWLQCLGQEPAGNCVFSPAPRCGPLPPRSDGPGMHTLRPRARACGGRRRAKACP